MAKNRGNFSQSRRFCPSPLRKTSCGRPPYGLKLQKVCTVQYVVRFGLDLLAAYRNTSIVRIAEEFFVVAPILLVTFKIEEFLLLQSF